LEKKREGVSKERTWIVERLKIERKELNRKSLIGEGSSLRDRLNWERGRGSKRKGKKKLDLYLIGGKSPPISRLGGE